MFCEYNVLFNYKNRDSPKGASSPGGPGKPGKPSSPEIKIEIFMYHI